MFAFVWKCGLWDYWIRPLGWGQGSEMAVFAGWWCAQLQASLLKSADASCLAPGTHAPPNGDNCSCATEWLQATYVTFWCWGKNCSDSGHCFIFFIIFFTLLSPQVCIFLANLPHQGVKLLPCNFSVLKTAKNILVNKCWISSKNLVLFWSGNLYGEKPQTSLAWPNAFISLVQLSKWFLWFTSPRPQPTLFTNTIVTGSKIEELKAKPDFSFSFFLSFPPLFLRTWPFHINAPCLP